VSVAYHIDGCWVCRKTKSSQKLPFICDECRSLGFTENRNNPKGFFSGLFWKPYVKVNLTDNY
jgi:hypothetical protein